MADVQKQAPLAAGAWGSRRSAFGFTVLGQLVQGAVRLGCLILLGRLAGKAVLGEVSAVLAIATFLALVWPQPAGAAAARYISTSGPAPDRQRAVAGFISRTVVVASPPLALVAGMIAWYWLDVSATLALWTALLAVCLGLATYARGVRNGRLHFRKGFAWDCAGAAVTLGVLFLVLWSGKYEHALSAFCAGHLVSALSAWQLRRGDRLAVAVRREIARYTAWTSIQVMAAGGLLQVTIALAALWATPAELGDLGAAVSIATPALLLSIALRTSSVPFVARQFAAGDRRGLQAATDTLMRIMVLVFIPVFGVACIWARELLASLYSDAFTSGSELLVILLLAVSLNCFNASHVWLIGGPAWGARALATCNGLGLGVGALVAAVASSLVPTTGAALGYLVGSLIGSGAATLVVWRSGSMPWAGVIARLLLGYALIAVAVLTTRDAGIATQSVVTALFLGAHLAAGRRDLRRIRRAD